MRIRMSKFMRISADADPDAELRYTSSTYFATYHHQVLCVTEVCCPGIATCFLCILHDRNFITIALECLKKKNQYIGPLPHPLPSLACRPLGLFWLQAITPNYSTCISYNFIFCRICLKFSHKFFTHILIHLKYKKGKSKIFENKVAS